MTSEKLFENIVIIEPHSVEKVTNIDWSYNNFS